MPETYVDLNADLGEGFGTYRLGRDVDLMPVISSANVACGLHAGDPVIMRKTVRDAIRNDVGIGAHVGYPDLWGFGRRTVQLSDDELYCFLLYQMGALAAFVGAEGAAMQHVKPHGTLYNEAGRREDLSRVICRAVRDFDDGLILFVPAGSITSEVARAMNLQVASEGFADRGYTSDGSLVPRGKPGAIIEDPQAVSKRAVALARGEVQAADGSNLELEVDTICLHGDTPGAVMLAIAVRENLEHNGITVRAAGTFLKE